MLRQRRNPAASAAWLVFMVALPYLGVPFYLFFGTRKLKGLEGKHRLFEPEARVAREPGGQLQHLLSSMQVPPAAYASEVRFYLHAIQAR